MTLHSGGRQRRWGYVWVFLAPPIVALPFLLLLSLGLGVDLPSWAMADPKSAVILALTMPMVIAYVAVRIYYWRRDARRTEAPQTGAQGLK
jgi:hypothetical protein